MGRCSYNNLLPVLSELLKVPEHNKTDDCCLVFTESVHLRCRLPSGGGAQHCSSVLLSLLGKFKYARRFPKWRTLHSCKKITMQKVGVAG